MERRLNLRPALVSEPRAERKEAVSLELSARARRMERAERRWRVPEAEQPTVAAYDTSPPSSASSPT